MAVSLRLLIRELEGAESPHPAGPVGLRPGGGRVRVNGDANIFPACLARSASDPSTTRVNTCATGQVLESSVDDPSLPSICL